MEKKRWLGYHWLLAVLIVLMDYFRSYVYGGVAEFYDNFTLEGIVYKITYLIAFFGTYIINYRIVCPLTLPRKKLIAYIGASLLMFLVFPAIRYLLEEIIIYGISGYHNYGERTRVLGYYIFDNSYYTLKALLFSTFMYLLYMYIQNKNAIHELEIEQKKAEKALLKSQLEPHFLFNTLNAFYVELIDTQPDIAGNIHKLSELLRYVTYEAEKDFMPLKQEIRFIEDYIYFYRKRFEDNMFLNFSVEGDSNGKLIPPLILIHFIENIFKHGILQDRDNPAGIIIKIGERELLLQTKNKVSRGESYSSTGIGRENLKKRLKLIFEERYEFEYGLTVNHFETMLRIPLKNR